jgi:hypothetical protein
VTNPDDEREVVEPADDEYIVSADPDSLPLEAEPADVLEQAQAVPTDDDEYRSG